jgi:hypothetical protein
MELAQMTIEQLRAAATDIRHAIFAYEMCGDTHRIPDASRRQKEIFDEISRRDAPAHHKATEG